MKIILRKDHELLGDEGKVIEVKEGYARNYLIPHGYAVAATKSNIKSLEEVQRQRAKKIEKERESAKKSASELDNTTIEISVKTGDEGKVYGSVTSQMIYDKLVEKGFDSIEKRKIMLHEPLKTTGEHEVEVRLQHSITAKIKVNVVSENQPVEETAQAEEKADENQSEETASTEEVKAEEEK